MPVSSLITFSSKSITPPGNITGHIIIPSKKCRNIDMPCPLNKIASSAWMTTT
jgi:hypothetical protein